MLSIIGNISMSEGTCLVRPSLEKSCLHWFARCATFTLTCLVVCSLLEHTTTLSQVASQLPGPWRTSCPLAGKPSWIQFESAHNTLMQMPFPNYPACGYREPHEKETATGTQPEEDEDIPEVSTMSPRYSWVSSWSVDELKSPPAYGPVNVTNHPTNDQLCTIIAWSHTSFLSSPVPTQNESVHTSTLNHHRDENTDQQNENALSDTTLHFVLHNQQYTNKI